MQLCDKNNQLRRLPKYLYNKGIGKVSMSGDQTNLNE